MEKWKYKKKVLRTNLIVVAVFLIFASIFFYIDNKKRNVIYKKELKEYKVLSIDKKLNDTIKSTYFPENARGGLIIQFVTLKNGEKFDIEAYKNLTEPNLHFGEIVREGIILQKNSNSDTLLVKDGNKEYLFLID
jgi:hypothetical protein